MVLDTFICFFMKYATLNDTLFYERQYSRKIHKDIFSQFE